MGALAPVARFQFLQEKPDICIFKKFKLLEFNLIFRKHCVCGAKRICKLDVACGLWLSASVLNHCTCWKECQRQKKKKVSTFVCSFLEGPLPSSGPRWGSGGAKEKGGRLLSLCTSRQLKTRFQCVLASCLHGDWENLQVLKKILFANLLIP